MTFYETEITRIRNICYSNSQQLEIAIGVKNFIDTSYCSDLSLDFLAHNRLVSKYHLLRIFKKYYGLTPRQYLIDRRIEMSKELLRNEMSVTDTCFAVGFTSVGSFSTLFKSKTGQPPSDYQKEQLSRSKLSRDS